VHVCIVMIACVRTHHTCVCVCVSVVCVCMCVGVYVSVVCVYVCGVCVNVVCVYMCGVCVCVWCVSVVCVCGVWVCVCGMCVSVCVYVCVMCAWVCVWCVCGMCVSVLCVLCVWYVCKCGVCVCVCVCVLYMWAQAYGGPRLMMELSWLILLPCSLSWGVGCCLSYLELPGMARLMPSLTSQLVKEIPDLCLLRPELQEGHHVHQRFCRCWGLNFGPLTCMIIAEASAQP